MNIERCEACRVRNTGWRAVPRFGKWLCPACASGVKRERAAEMLTLRRRLLARLEAEDSADPGIRRFRREVALSIETLERRAREESESPPETINDLYEEASAK